MDSKEIQVLQLLIELILSLDRKAAERVLVYATDMNRVRSDSVEQG